MTNWLDPDEVRAERALWEKTFPLEGGRLDAWIEVAGGCVLKALAALPEPPEMCTCGVPIRDHDGGWPDHNFTRAKETMLHRIWTVARIVCGKEEA